jgi:hypothetical protein
LESSTYGANRISAALTLGSTRADMIWPKAGLLLMAVGVLVLLALGVGKPAPIGLIASGSGR